MFATYLNTLIQRSDLTEDQTAAVIDEMFAGKLTDAQIGAFIAALAVKGETAAELAGAARAMRRRAVRIQTNSNVVVDTCGTGGDGGGTFNISTTTAFVVAGAGVTVAKHGNRSVSSKCGSADVLEALGVRLDVAPEVTEEAVQTLGIGFLFAPAYHGAMRYAMPARQQLGVRTIFNMLGPLTNPAGANCQLLGVFAPQLTEMFAHALNQLGARRAFVVHGHDGLDEISICAATRISELKDGQVRTYDMTPETYFGEPAEPAALAGGDAQVNAGITRQILEGRPGAPRDVVLINAAAALVAAGQADDLKQGLGVAADSIDSGAARDKLAQLVTFTRENG